MDATLTETKNPEYLPLALGKLLEEHKGGEVVVMDMRSLNFWTDFFIIATVTSGTHLSGLERHIKEFAHENGMEILRHSRRPEVKKMDTGSFFPSDSGDGIHPGPSFDEWRLIDFGEIVIHLMTTGTRSFFELERLWSAARVIYGNGYSSKSS